MLTAGEVDYLLDATRSTVKRFGGDTPSLAHLAYVLSGKWPDDFAKAFGEDGADDVKRLLQEKSFVGDEADVRSILADHDSPASTLTELHARLSSLIEADHSAADAAAGTDAGQPTESPAPLTQPAAPAEGS